jgi:hypothetical protein
MRTIVFFHYYENNTTYKENLIYFLSVAYRYDIDYVVIISGDCSVKLPNLNNIKYMYTDNKNNDYGGYVVALKEMGDSINNYENFVFVNSSVRGPFTKGVSSKNWLQLFFNEMKGEVNLVGSSINIIPDDNTYAVRFKNDFGYPTPYSHVQTTAYVLSIKALKHLINIGFYDCDILLSKEDVICRYELGLSQEIKKAGWNIKALLQKYNSIDYRFPHQDINPTSKNGDPLYKGSYFGSTANYFDLVFVKTNRNIASNVGLYFNTFVGLTFHANEKMKSWPEFRRLQIFSLFQFLKSLAYVVFKRIQRIFFIP